MTILDLLRKEEARGAIRINEYPLVPAPCVFCLGNAAFLAEDPAGTIAVPSNYAVQCSLCLACGPAHPTPEAAVKDWNFAWERLQHYINQMGRWVAEKMK